MSYEEAKQQHSSEVAQLEKEVLEDIIDLEEHAPKGQRLPKARGYRIKVTGELFVVEKELTTGREILEVAGISPPEKHGLYIKVHGNQYRRVELDESVDLRAPGVEKFKTLPLDQTEGGHDHAT